VCAALQRLDEYVSSGRMDKEVDFSGDDLILAALAAAK
jgi:hypothetical protein